MSEASTIALVVALLTGSLIPGIAAIINAVNSRKSGVKSDERTARADVVSEYKDINEALRLENGVVRSERDQVRTSYQGLDIKYHALMGYATELRLWIENKKPPPPPDYPPEI